MTREDMASALLQMSVFDANGVQQFHLGMIAREAGAELRKKCVSCKHVGTCVLKGCSSGPWCRKHNMHVPDSGFCHCWEPKPTGKRKDAAR